MSTTCSLRRGSALPRSTTFLESHPRLFGAQAPVGYFAFPSSTYNVFLFFRTLMTQGENGPDPAAGAVNAERTRVYPLFEVLRLVRRLPVDEAAEPPAARRGTPPDLLLLSATTPECRAEERQPRRLGREFELVLAIGCAVEQGVEGRPLDLDRMAAGAANT